MKYGFFPGCTLESAAYELMISTKKVAEALETLIGELRRHSVAEGLSHESWSASANCFQRRGRLVG